MIRRMKTTHEERISNASIRSGPSHRPESIQLHLKENNMDRNTVIAALGFKTTGGSRSAVVEAFKKAAEKGLSVTDIQAVAGNQSKTGDVSRTVASLVSHLRTKENCDILKDDEKYYLIGMNTKDGWVAEPWVETRMSRE